MCSGSRRSEPTSPAAYLDKLPAWTCAVDTCARPTFASTGPTRAYRATWSCQATNDGLRGAGNWKIARGSVICRTALERHPGAQRIWAQHDQRASEADRLLEASYISLYGCVAGIRLRCSTAGSATV